MLRRARERNPEVCAVVITEGAEVEMAVEAMRQGAYDFQVKPLQLEKLLAVLERGLSHQALAARWRRWRASSTSGSGSSV